jgi:Rps23 Pro-64 3,4-dihydroxylase Tpa1-like proline 4-hydroxylase
MTVKASQRPRSPSPNRSTKRQKLSVNGDLNSSSDSQAPEDLHNTPIAKHFASSLLLSSNIEKLKNEYAASRPYKHVVVDALFEEKLLDNVREECVEKLAFTEKETDIYKVRRVFCRLIV